MVPWRNMRPFLGMVLLMIGAVLAVLVLRIETALDDGGRKESVPIRHEQVLHPNRHTRDRGLVANPVLRIAIPERSVFAPPPPIVPSPPGPCGGTIPCVVGLPSLISKAESYVNYQ